MYKAFSIGKRFSLTFITFRTLSWGPSTHVGKFEPERKAWRFDLGRLRVILVRNPRKPFIPNRDTLSDDHDAVIARRVAHALIEGLVFLCLIAVAVAVLVSIR